MSDFVEELARLTGWTGRRGRRYDAERVRAELGTDLPADYVDLVSTFGCGMFDDAIILLEPGRLHYDLVAVTKRERHNMRRILQGGSLGEDEIPSAVRPPHGDPLITWAVSDYGLNFHWRCSPWDQPDRWPVVAFVLAEPWHEYKMTATEFLVRLLDGSIEHPSWDPVEHHHFVPFDDLPGGEAEPTDTLAVEAVTWLPDVLVQIDPADDSGLDLSALQRWLWDHEALHETGTSIGLNRTAHTGYRMVLELTVGDYRGRPVVGQAVATWMRSNGVLFTGKITCDDATTYVHEATPEAVEELIRTLGTAG